MNHYPLILYLSWVLSAASMASVAIQADDSKSLSKPNFLLGSRPEYPPASGQFHLIIQGTYFFLPLLLFNLSINLFFPMTGYNGHVHLVVSDSATPRVVAYQTPLSMEFSRQEFWSELPFPPPGDLLNPETEPRSPALAGRFFSTAPPGKPPS